MRVGSNSMIEDGLVSVDIRVVTPAKESYDRVAIFIVLE